MSSLLSAIQYGDQEEVKCLLESGVSCDLETIGGEPILHWVVSRGDTTIASLLVTGGALLNRFSSVGETPLHIAVGDRSQELAEILLQGGASVNLPTGHNESPLYIAASENHSELAKLLAEYGADVNLSTYAGETPLHCAVRHKNLTVAHMVLEKGANVNAATTEGVTALHTAMEQQDRAMVELLLKYGADVTARTGVGDTVLHAAVQHGDAALAQLLLDKGADANAINRQGLSPMHLAVKERYAFMVSLLLAGGAEASYMKGILHAALEERNQAIVMNLLNAGADANDLNSEGESPLIVATRLGYQCIVSRLLTLGADIAHRTPHGNNALHIAVISQNIGVVKVVLQHGGIDIDLPNNDGWTPLLIAVKLGPTGVVKALLVAGADVNRIREETDDARCKLIHESLSNHNKKDIDVTIQKYLPKIGVSPLLRAASHGKCDIVKLMLRHEPEFNIVDHDGQGVVHWATYHCMLHPLHMMLLRGAALNQRSIHGLRPLELILQAGAHPSITGPQLVISCITLLIQHGSDIDPSTLTLVHPSFAEPDLYSWLTNVLVEAGTLTAASNDHLTSVDAKTGQGLRSTHKQAVSLMMCSRRVIRQSVRSAKSDAGSIWSPIVSLPIPIALQEYLLLQEHQTSELQPDISLEVSK